MASSGRGETGERPAGGRDGRAKRRMEDPGRELAGEVADLDRPVRREHVVEVRLEGVEVRRQERRRDAERPPDGQRLLVVPGALVARSSGSSQASYAAIVESTSVAWTHRASSGSSAL